MPVHSPLARSLVLMARRSLIFSMVGLAACASACAGPKKHSSKTSGARSTSIEAPGPLRWARPSLADPKVVDVPTEETVLRLDPGVDYIVRLPSQATGPLTLDGGRNITLIGGEIRTTPESTSRRGLYIKNATGVVHVEGLRIIGDTELGSDGIAIAAPKATVQLQYLRITSITGWVDGFHGDLIQPWGGVRSLRIDHLTGRSTYQGLFLRPDLGAIRSIDLSNIDIAHPGDWHDGSGYLMWLSTGCDTADLITFKNVYLDSASSGHTLGWSVWPNVSGTSCPAVLSGSTVTWPSLPVRGRVNDGRPAEGDYVPADTIGLALR